MKIAVLLVCGLAAGLHAADGPLPVDPVPARAAARLLEQASWGPTPASIAAVQSIGLPAWLEQQYVAAPSNLPDQPLLASGGKPNHNLAPVQAAFFQNALAGQDQLRQRVAFALSEMWVVSAAGGVTDAYAYPVYWRVLRNNAFANYRDIIKAVTLSPAMGRYLNMANNNKGNAAKGTAANENYARELMQLFTLGLYQLNPDGSLVVDSSKNPVPAYDQSVVTNMARVFTGWTYPTAPGATAKTNNPPYYIGLMLAVEQEHDETAKSIFGGVTIPAWQTAGQDLETVLDAFMKQPSLAPFVCKQLIQHLVTSNPSPAYIQRVSNAFTRTSGDMKTVITAILMDPEARAGDTDSTSVDPNFGHLREPVLFMANLLRGLNATLGTSSAIQNYSTEMGQELFYAPSVFSYFSPQSRTERGLLGPEFQIYSTQTVANRADTVNRILYSTLDTSTKIDLTPFEQFVGDTELLAYINSTFLHGAMSADLSQAAAAAINAASTARAKVQTALYTVLTSGEFQIIH